MIGKWIGSLIIVLVLGFSFWQVSRIGKVGSPAVLSSTSTKTVEERLASLESRVYTLEKNAGLVASTSIKASESFVALTGGSISSFEWTKISGTDFTFDASLYGKTVEVSWQGWISGAASVRLYDSTNHRAVDFSEFTSATDGSKSFYTKTMAIWRGQNQYYIEGKISGGMVTLSSPRLKVLAK